MYQTGVFGTRGIPQRPIEGKQECYKETDSRLKSGNNFSIAEKKKFPSFIYVTKHQFVYY